MWWWLKSCTLTECLTFPILRITKMDRYRNQKECTCINIGYRVCLFPQHVCIVIVNPWRTCTARVTVLGVHLSVCVSVTQHLTTWMIICAINKLTYSAVNEGQILSKNYKVHFYKTWLWIDITILQIVLLQR